MAKPKKTPAPPKRLMPAEGGSTLRGKQGVVIIDELASTTPPAEPADPTKEA